MTDKILDEITQVIIDDPRSGQSLLLFALVATLKIEKTGHMYMLGKLKEFTEESRQLAYSAIELMAKDTLSAQEWQDAFSKMETAIRG